ncbi:methane/ammonia monooxygenase subunit C, partial [Nitrosospira briensis]
MATAVENRALDKAKASSAAFDMSEWYDSRYYKIGLLPILGIAMFWVWFQR